MRFFFDLKKEQDRVLDYVGEDFRDHKVAIKHAQAIAEHMAHRMSADWLGWAVELRNAHGIKFIEIPVVLEVITDAGSFQGGIAA